MANIFDTGKEGLVAQIFETLNEILISGATQLATKLSVPSAAMFKSFISIVIFFYIYQVVSTRSYDVRTLIEVIVRIAIFWSLITVGAWLTALVIPVLFTFPEAYGEFVTGGLGLADTNPVLALSDLVALVWKNVQVSIESIKGNAVEKAGKVVLLYAVGFVAVFTVGLMAIASFMYIGGGQIVTAVLLCVFPLFAAFGFLPATKDLFQAWIRAAIWAIVLQLVAYTILALMLKMFSELFKVALQEGKGFMENTEVAVTVLGTAAFLGGLGTTMIRMTPMIAGLLGSANIHIAGIHPEKPFNKAGKRALKGLGSGTLKGVAALSAAAMARGGAAGARGRASAAADRAERIVNK